METNMTNLFSLIKFYFDRGLRHWEIVLSLSHIDGITISLLTSPEDFAVAQKLSPFRSARHSNVSPGSVGLI